MPQSTDRLAAAERSSQADTVSTPRPIPNGGNVNGIDVRVAVVALSRDRDERSPPLLVSRVGGVRRPDLAVAVARLVGAACTPVPIPFRQIRVARAELPVRLR